jgi:hypothetical protein
VPLSQHEHPAATQVKAVNDADLVALRQATARFHEFAEADTAGWNFLIPDPTGPSCFSGPDGGMGYHYANTGLLDGTVNPAEPEALLYEPQKNGQLRLVGVEYIVPAAAWPHPTPPELYGQQFPYIPKFDVYGLHVWVWQHNPNGMFTPYNPAVSCAYAPGTK